MRIAFVNQALDRVLPPGQNSVGLCTYGVTKSLSSLCEVLVYGVKDRHKDIQDQCRENVSFFFVGATSVDRILQSARARASQFLNIRSPFSASSLLFPGYGKRVALALQKQGCDVIHIQQCSQYAPIIRAYNPSAKIVLHLHAPWYSQINPNNLAARLHNVDLVTTVSDFVRANVVERLPMVADRCETVHNGIEAADFTAERIYKAGNGEKRILFVGAVSPHSGVHVLLDAFRIVAEKLPNVRLEIVGPQGSYPIEEMFDHKDLNSIQAISMFYRKRNFARLKAKLLGGPTDSGTYMAALRSQLSGTVAGKVNFRGPIGDRPALVKEYYSADVFAFPPVCNHGFGLPPLEAMAAGTPVVATRSGALAETVIHNDTGLLVKRLDAEGLAHSLLTLLENDPLRLRMGRAARSGPWPCSAGMLPRQELLNSTASSLRSKISTPHMQLPGVSRSLTDARPVKLSEALTPVLPSKLSVLATE